MTATAQRSPSRHHTTPIGTGELHNALEDARDLGRLHDFCKSNGCSVEQVSKDGKRLHMLMVFDLMRSRGYVIAAPVRNQHQPRRDQTTWLVSITLPDRTSVQLGFCTPNTS